MTRFCGSIFGPSTISHANLNKKLKTVIGMVNRLRLHNLNCGLNPTGHSWFVGKSKIKLGTRNRAYSLCWT